MTALTSRPWLVMVTGEPGSGKSTLGRELASQLRVPFLSRDHIRGGLLATAGLWTGQLQGDSSRQAALDAFVELVETTARLGITAVIEFVVTPERVEAFDRIQAAARCIVIVTTSATAATRANTRDNVDPLLNRSEVLDALGYESIDDYLRDPERTRLRAEMTTSFDQPLLSVATDDGYDPPLDEIASWVIEQTRR